MNFLFKKKKRLIQLLSLTLFYTCIMLPSKASAYSIEFGATKFPNQYDIRIKYIQLGSKDISPYINIATSAWNSSPARVLFTRNSTSNNIDLISGNYGDIGWYGLCYYPTILNGNFSRIQINDSLSGINGNESETIAHELGHALGLAHTETTLMRKTGWNYSPTPHTDDINGVNSRY